MTVICSFLLLSGKKKIFTFYVLIRQKVFQHVGFFSYENCTDLDKIAPLTRVSATELCTAAFITEVLM